MNHYALLSKIKRLYHRGENIMEYLRKEKKVQDNDKETILISYDFQAGSYIKFVEENPDFIQYYTQAIALVFEGLGINFETVLEVGVGEATVLGNLAKKISKKMSFIWL